MSLSSICTGKRNAGKDVLERVLTAFPDISRPWLYFGEGEMLKPAAVQHNSGNQNCTITNIDNSTTCTEEISELRSQLKDANETIHQLTDMLSRRIADLEKAAKLVTDMLSDEE